MFFLIYLKVFFVKSWFCCPFISSVSVFFYEVSYKSWRVTIDSFWSRVSHWEIAGTSILACNKIGKE